MTQRRALAVAKLFIQTKTESMKKTFTLLLFLLCALHASAQEVEVPETQLSLITKVTASWCINCGAWGWDLFEDLIAENSGKAVLIAAHYSGSLQNAATTEYTGNLSFLGQPAFFLGAENLSANSGNAATVRQTVRDTVDQAFEESPVVQTGIRATLDPAADDLNLRIELKTRFFQEAEGEYSLGLYTLDKLLIAPQTGQGNMAQHKLVLEDALIDQPFGLPLADGAVAAGTSDDFYGEFNIDPEEAAGTQIVTIIWRKVDDAYLPVNCNFGDIATLSATTGRTLPGLAWRVVPNPAGAQAEVLLTLEEALPAATLSLRNAAGQEVAVMHRGALPAGDHRFTIPSPAAGGAYWLQLAGENRIAVRPVVFR